MQHSFNYVGISYKDTPLEIREKLTFDEKDGRTFIAGLKEKLGLAEALILSTCNRTEIYYSSDEDVSESILKLISIEKDPDRSIDLKQHFTICTDATAAALHLFRVAAGLESQVLGDFQITNQVKKAYQWCADEDMAGPFLHRLMHTIFYTNKRIVQETAFRDGAASVSYATSELIDELTINLIDPRICVIGIGEIGADVCRNLKESGKSNVVICNRTEETGKELAEELDYEFRPIDNLYKQIELSDVVVSSVGAAEPIIKLDFMQNIHIPGYKHLIDLGVPRSIDKGVEQIAGVSLHNIDHIQATTNEALEKRLAAVSDVERIIDESIADFKDWTKEMLVSPAISKFKNALEEIRKEEIAKYLKDSDEELNKRIDQVTKNIMNKIVKLPALNLKAACKRDEAENLVEVLTELFDLEKKNEKTS